ncbi:OLC1v1032029C1 [Oldenlandia corymbosa var. corymbosa]|uniref:OLC1v1032029C1 n=1 Tax=Oldenlandia corymbosa var. corymbosa TaxID=529605 RepID=A0AAV1CLK6_OLDCO|nr:OLC1v1032029C1 [Oldenlandia corymbosa var. corymbosa]
MDDELVKRVFEGGGRDYYQQPPSTSSSSSSILQSLPLHVTFDHGYYLLVKSIQELRSKKDGLVTVGIGGPSGSGKSSLADKVASVIGCTVISMENYRMGLEDGNDLDLIDFDLLVQNIEDLMNGIDAFIPLFDYQGRKRVGSEKIRSTSSGVIIVDGTYALHSRLRSLLDIRVAVVGGVHFSLLSKVQYDIGESCSLDHLIDSIFPQFRKHIEPDLHHAQIRINNSFVSSFREPIYKLKCKSESQIGHEAYIFQGKEAIVDNFIEMYLRPPSASEEAQINDWIKVRQSGIKYYLSLGDQRIVDKNFIIRPKAEFEVGRMTLGGLLALGYSVVVSYKRTSTSVNEGNLSISLETIDTLGETYMVLRGTNRKMVGTEASRMGINGPWITKSYLELILESKGVPRLNTPPPLAAAPAPSNRERLIAAPKPVRITPNLVNQLEDLSLPWTRSPTKSKMEPVVARWQFVAPDEPLSDGSIIDPSSSRPPLQLAPLPDSYDLDRGLLLAVQAILALLENKGAPVVVGIGGPSGSGKTSLARKMANIVGCEVVSLESYYKSEQVKDFKYDDFSSLDLALLSKNIDDIRNRRRTKVPVFDLENGTRSGFRDFEVLEDCGVVIFEGVYALHPRIRRSLDLWIAVVGGVHSHLISRVQRDKSKVGCLMSHDEIMTTVFPIFQQHIEPHLVHAHLKIRNDFDPVLSPESSLFVLKSDKQVAYQDILKILDSGKLYSSVQSFTDIYLCLPGLPANGHLKESDCIRVRICEGRFALLIREPIREGNFIIQPKVDFDISISTVAGLLNLGYQAVASIEASAYIYQDGKILVEVDHLQDVSSPYIQIKGVNKEIVTAAGSALKLDDSYTTKSYLEIILERLPGGLGGIHSQHSAKLQELLEFIQSQGSNSASESSQSREVSSVECMIEEMQTRIRRLERWQAINTNSVARITDDHDDGDSKSHTKMVCKDPSSPYPHKILPPHKKKKKKKPEAVRPTTRNLFSPMKKFTAVVMEVFTAASGGSLPESRRALLQDRVSHFVSRLHSPDHPPYAWMIERALRELNERQGSSEDSISNFIKNEYHDLPWSHLTMLKYHLARLCQSGELVLTSGQRYLLAAAISERKERTKHRKLKRKRGSDREIMRSKRHKKVNKGDNNLNADNIVGLLLSQQKDRVISNVLSREEECTIDGNKQKKPQNHYVELLCSQHKDQLISKEINKHGARTIEGNSQQMLEGDKVGLLLFQENNHGASKDSNEERDCIMKETKQQEAKAKFFTGIVEDNDSYGDTDVPLNIAPGLVKINGENDFSNCRTEEPRCDPIAGITDSDSSDAQMHLVLEEAEYNDPELAATERPPGFELVTFEQSSQLQRFKQNDVLDFGDAHGKCSEPEVLIFKESNTRYCTKRYSRQKKRQPVVGKTLSLPPAEIQEKTPQKPEFPHQDKAHSRGQTSPEHQREEKVAQGNQSTRVLRSQTCKQNQSEGPKSEYPIHGGILHEKLDAEVTTELTLTTHQIVGRLHKGPKSEPSHHAVRNNLTDDLRKKKSGLKPGGRPPKSSMPAKDVPDRILLGDIAPSNDQDQEHHERPLHPSLEKLDVTIVEMLAPKPADNPKREQKLTKAGRGRPPKSKGSLHTAVKSILMKARHGRLPKLKEPVSAEEESSLKKQKLGRPRKLIEPVSSEVETSLTKRKRGRPPKPKGPVSEAVESSLTKPKLGRPPKDSAAQSSLTKPKLGRPRKGAASESSLEKPKLGRPLKPKGPVSPAVESSLMIPKLGRPPKHKAPVITAVKSSLKKKTTNKCRGRPRLTDR